MNKIHTFWELIIKKDEMNIYRRILRTALFGSLLTFLVMALLSVFSMLILHKNLENRGNELSDNVSLYLESDLHEKLNFILKETTALRAQNIFQILKIAYDDVEELSQKITHILKHPDQHVNRILPIANFESVPINKPYIFYTPSLINQGISENLQNELGKISSIDDDLKYIENYYGSVVVASKKGYVLRIDDVRSDNDISVLCQDSFRNTYDPRKKEWYTNTLEAGKTILTDPYMASYGKPCVSICTPYYDENNDIGGVIVVDINTDYVNENMTYSNGGGFSFLLSKNGEVIISPKKDGIFASLSIGKDLRQAEDKKFAETIKFMTEGKKGTALIEVDGKEYYLAYAPLENTGWSIGTVSDKDNIDEMIESLDNYTTKIIENYIVDLRLFFLIAAITAFIIFTVTLYFILKLNVRMAKEFAAPIKNLIEGVQEISKGNLKKTLNIKTGDELETLADNFNQMTLELTNYMENLANTTAKNERIETELSVATQIQAGMLPNGKNLFADRSEFDTAALMRPAKAVGGDFYDFYLLDENHLVVTVADVSDKGVPAALFMAISKIVLKENLQFFRDVKYLDKVFEVANDTLLDSDKEGMFVTVFTGVLDTATGEFVYVNAGHNPPIIKQAGNGKYFPKALNPVMCAVEGMKFKMERVMLKPGDLILLYTDGVTEARNEKKEFYGDNRLLKVAECLGSSANADIEKIYSEVKNFSGTATQADDITILEVIYHGQQKERNE